MTCIPSTREKKQKESISRYVRCLINIRINCLHKGIKNLNTLFTDLAPPVIREPKEQKAKVTTDNDENEITTAVTRLQEAIFGEEIKQYIKESRSLNPR